MECHNQIIKDSITPRQVNHKLEQRSQPRGHIFTYKGCDIASPSVQWSLWRSQYAWGGGEVGPGCGVTARKDYHGQNHQSCSHNQKIIMDNTRYLALDNLTNAITYHIGIAGSLLYWERFAKEGGTNNAWLGRAKTCIKWRKKIQVLASGFYYKNIS
jgi:hypothetical protein